MFRGLDIFSGVGGSSAGARAAGIEMIGAIDLWPVATATYQANFPEARVITGKLEEVNVCQLKRQLGRIDLLLASPECTNHTCAKGAAPRNEASRATAMQVVRFAEAFLPRWFVLENVVHMRPWARYEELKISLRKLGYNVAEQLLDSSDLGVPQTRRRLFLVGDLRGDPGLVRLGRPERRKSARSILDRPGTWKRTPLYIPSRAEGTIHRAQRAFDELGPNASFLLVYYGTDGSGGWQRLRRPLRTVTTLDRFALVEHTTRGPVMRMLQVDELKRAMGFNDKFLLPFGTRRDRIKLLGNGVCPPVMRRVVKALVRSDEE
jgi:DNA (cytosine-5)-methyltransferase 1